MANQKVVIDVEARIKESGLENMAKRLQDEISAIYRKQSSGSSQLGKEIVNDLKNTIDAINETKTEYKNILNEFNKGKIDSSKLDNFSKEFDSKISEITKRVTALEQNITEVVKRIGTGATKLDSFQAQLSSMREEFNNVVGSAKGAIEILEKFNSMVEAGSKKKVKNDNSGLKEQVEQEVGSFSFKNGGIKVPVSLDTKQLPKLQKKYNEIINMLQQYAKANPVDVTMRLFPLNTTKAGAKEVTEAVRNVQAQIASLPEGELKNSMNSLYGDLEKQYQKALRLKVDVELSENQQSIKQRIKELNDAVKEQGFTIYPNFDIEDTDADAISAKLSELQEKITLKVTSEIKSMSDSLTNLFNTTDIEKWSTNFINGLNNIQKKLNTITPLIQQITGISTTENKGSNIEGSIPDEQDVNVLVEFTNAMKTLRESLEIQQNAEINIDINPIMEKLDVLRATIAMVHSGIGALQSTLQNVKGTGSLQLITQQLNTLQSLINKIDDNSFNLEILPDGDKIINDIQQNIFESGKHVQIPIEVSKSDLDVFVKKIEEGIGQSSTSIIKKYLNIGDNAKYLTSDLSKAIQNEYPKMSKTLVGNLSKATVEALRIGMGASSNDVVESLISNNKVKGKNIDLLRGEAFKSNYTNLVNRLLLPLINQETISNKKKIDVVVDTNNAVDSIKKVSSALDKLPKKKNVTISINGLSGTDKNLGEIVSEIADADRTMAAIGTKKRVSEHGFYYNDETKRTSNTYFTGPEGTERFDLAGELYQSVAEEVNTYIHSHPYNYAAMSLAIKDGNDINGDIISFYDNYLKGINTQIITGFKDVQIFDAKKFFSKYGDYFNDDNKSTTAVKLLESMNEVRNDFSENMLSYFNKFSEVKEDFVNSLFSDKEFYLNTNTEISRSKNVLSSKVNSKVYDLLNKLSTSITDRELLSYYQESDKSLEDSIREYIKNKLTTLVGGEESLLKTFSSPIGNESDIYIESLTKNLYKKISNTEQYQNLENELYQKVLRYKTPKIVKDVFGEDNWGQYMSDPLTIEEFKSKYNLGNDFKIPVQVIGTVNDPQQFADNVTKQLNGVSSKINVIPNLSDDSSIKNNTIDESKLLTKKQAVKQLQSNLQVTNVEAEKIFSEQNYTKKGNRYAIEQESINKLIDTLKEKKNIENHSNNLNAEDEEFKNISDSAQEASQSKKNFAEANAQVISSIIKSLNGLENEGKAFDNLNRLINNLGGKNGDKKLQDTLDGLELIRDQLSQPINNNSILTALIKLSDQGENLKDLATILKASKTEIEQAQSSIKTKSSKDENVKERIKTINELNALYAWQAKNQGKINSNDSRMTDRSQQIQQLEIYLEELEKVQLTEEQMTEVNQGISKSTQMLRDAEAKAAEDAAKREQRANEEAERSRTKKAEQAEKDAAREEKAETKLENRRSELLKRVGKLQGQGQINKVYGEELKEFENILNNLPGEVDEADKSMTKIYQRLAQIEGQAQATGKVGQSITQMLGNRFKSLLAYLGSFATFYDIIRYIRQAATNVIQLNDAFIELSKVSNTSIKSLEGDFQSYADIAKDIGGTITDTINATADWARMGMINAPLYGDI